MTGNYTREYGANGKPCRRSPSLVEIIREQTNDGRAIVELMIDVMQGRIHSVDRDGLEVMATTRDRIEAAKVLLAYGFAKPAEALEISGEITQTIAQTVLEARERAMRALPPAKQQVG